MAIEAVSEEMGVDPSYQAAAIRRMEFVDEMPAELRACVHDFGLPIVEAFLEHGIGRPKTIRHLIMTIMLEMTGQEPSNYANNKTALDARAAAWLWGGGYLVVPKIPTPEMVTASVDALVNAGLSDTFVERRQKHTVRLIHANVAGHIGPLNGDE